MPAASEWPQQSAHHVTTAIGAAASADRSFPIVELRRYRLHEGRRDELIALFEREFVAPQEAAGMMIIGTFTNVDRPDEFVWLRAFPGMEERFTALTAFYDGPVWAAHRAAANATMIDSDNVLLLRAVRQFDRPRAEPGLGPAGPPGLVVATIYHLDCAPSEALRLFAGEVRPALEEAGIQPLAWLVPETLPNDFERLPVREGEQLLVWFAAFDDEADHASRGPALKKAGAPLAPLLSAAPEQLRLKPTSGPLLRGRPTTRAPSDGRRDFDFLHGRWNVHHRVLDARGAGCTDWSQFQGTAETRALLGGLCNVEEHRIEGRDSGVALRCFDKTENRWAIYWASDLDGVLGPPVHGSFDGRRGLFTGDEVHDGRRVKVRFLWTKISADHARWEQSFSFDQGASWETNWTMEFNRKRDRCSEPV